MWFVEFPVWEWETPVEIAFEARFATTFPPYLSPNIQKYGLYTHTKKGSRNGIAPANPVGFLALCHDFCYRLEGGPFQSVNSGDMSWMYNFKCIKSLSEYVENNFIYNI